MNVDLSNVGDVSFVELAKEARKLRNIVFGKPISDGEWQHCAHNWIRDLPWLREQAAKKHEHPVIIQSL